MHRFGIGEPADPFDSDSSSESDSDLDELTRPIGRAVVKHAFGGQRAGELDIIDGQTIQLLSTEGADLPEGFWRGRLENGDTGLFPQNFVDEVEMWPLVERRRAGREQETRLISVDGRSTQGLGVGFYGCCAAHWVSLMLGYQAEYLIWQAHFPGDFGTRTRRSSGGNAGRNSTS